MNWLQKISEEQLLDGEQLPEQPTERLPDGMTYPMAGEMVGELRVLEQVDNMSSIGASLFEYEILPGIREIPMSDFGSAKPHDTFYARTDIQRCRSLAEEIRASGEIMPLIVVIDDKQVRKRTMEPYILEGGHRFVALHLLGIQSLPALVVIDKNP